MNLEGNKSLVLMLSKIKVVQFKRRQQLLTGSEGAFDLLGWMEVVGWTLGIADDDG